jgi:hypothetical protein
MQSTEEGMIRMLLEDMLGEGLYRRRRSRVHRRGVGSDAISPVALSELS